MGEFDWTRTLVFVVFAIMVIAALLALPPKGKR